MRRRFQNQILSSFHLEGFRIIGMHPLIILCWVSRFKRSTGVPVWVEGEIQRQRSGWQKLQRTALQVQAGRGDGGTINYLMREPVTPKSYRNSGKNSIWNVWCKNDHLLNKSTLWQANIHLCGNSAVHTDCNSIIRGECKFVQKFSPKCSSVWGSARPLFRPANG